MEVNNLQTELIEWRIRLSQEMNDWRKRVYGHETSIRAERRLEPFLGIEDKLSDEVETERTDSRGRHDDNRTGDGAPGSSGAGRTSSVAEMDLELHTDTRPVRQRTRKPRA